MGERDDASREAADARARLSELALELGRRTNPDYVREQARELISERRGELKERVKERVKEKAVRTTDEFRHNSRGVGTLGALVGAGVGAMLARRFLLREGEGAGVPERRRPSDYGYRSTRDIEHRYGHGDVRYEGDVRLARGTTSGAYDVPMDRGEPYVGERIAEEEGGGIREKAGELRGRASDMAHSVRERASGMSHSVRERASGMSHSVRERASGMSHSMRERTGGMVERVRDRIPSREELRDRGGHVREYARDTYDNRPMIMALGAVAFGFLASQLIPVSERERRAFRPAKDMARERAHDAYDTARSKAEQKIGAVQDVLGIKGGHKAQGDGGGRVQTSAAPPAQPSGVSTESGYGPGVAGGSLTTAPGNMPSGGDTSTGTPGISAGSPTEEGRGIGPLPPLDDVTKRGY